MNDLSTKGGFITGIYTANGAGKRLEPAYIANSRYAESNDNFLMLHRTSTGHYSSLLHHHALPPIPNSLVASLGVTIPQVFDYISPRAHILTGQRDVTIKAFITPIPTTLRSQFVIPIYEHDIEYTPSSRIRQNSRIQITTSGITPSYTTNLFHVRGSRGFTSNNKYEILELVDSFTPENLRVVWLQITPPHIHLDVVLINDESSPNRRRHDKLLSLFEGELRYSQKSEPEDCLKEQRSMLTWKVLQRYSDARRRQNASLGSFT